MCQIMGKYHNFLKNVDFLKFGENWEYDKKNLNVGISDIVALPLNLGKTVQK